MGIKKRRIAYAALLVLLAPGCAVVRPHPWPDPELAARLMAAPPPAPARQALPGRRAALQTELDRLDDEQIGATEAARYRIAARQAEILRELNQPLTPFF